MKRIIFVLLIFTGVSAFTQEFITVNPPSFETTSDNPLIIGIVDQINNELSAAADEIKNELEDVIGEFNTNPEKLIRAFGNTGVYASHGATQRAFGGYKTFAITGGTMIGLRMPANPFKIREEFEDISDKIQTDGDIDLGFNIQVLNAQLGINMSFLLENLYLGLRIGGFKIEPDNFITNLFEDGNFDFGFNSFVFGITGNYQLLAPRNLTGLFTWRGLNLETGFIFQKTNLNLSLGMGEVISVPIIEPIPGVTGNLEFDPTFTFGIDIRTFTIPLEAVTAVKILFINIPIGLGADLAFGNSKMKMDAVSEINTNVVIPSQVTGIVEIPGDITINIDEKKRPSFFNFKLMTGIGFALGPVLIDIPFTYYFTKGYNVGLTIGVAF